MTFEGQFQIFDYDAPLSEKYYDQTFFQYALYMY